MATVQGRRPNRRRLCTSQIGVLIVATSPSEKWENGKMVKRNIETNRWTVPDDNAEPEEAEEAEAKAVAPNAAENKGIKAPSKK